jgi:hypothetical protein
MKQKELPLFYTQESLHQLLSSQNSIRVPTTQSLNPEEPSLLKGKTLALLRRERGEKKEEKSQLVLHFRVSALKE